MIPRFRRPRYAGAHTPASRLFRPGSTSGDRVPGRRLATVVAAAFFMFSLPLASTVSGQAPAGLSQGTKSLSFAIDGSGSSEAGVWIFISDRTTLGLLGTLDWESEDRGGPRNDRSHLTVGLGPAVKWYLPPIRRVAPYWHGGLGFSHTRRSEEGEEDRTSRSVGLDGGFGVDWFPVDRMSVGGWTGLRFTSGRAENDDTSTRLRTLTTGLRVHFYF